VINPTAYWCVKYVAIDREIALIFELQQLQNLMRHCHHYFKPMHHCVIKALVLQTHTYIMQLTN